MTSVTLPEDLDLETDLELLNRQVHEASVQLDWSGVRAASPEALGRLLAGCNLSQHANPLGIGTIPAQLTGTILDVLFGNESPTSNGNTDVVETVSGDGTEKPDAALGPLLQVPTPVEIRQRLLDLVEKDLLGPQEGPNEEVLDDRVTDRYVVGLLAPSGEPMREDADDELAVAGDDGSDEGAAEPDAVGPRTMFPSSFGLSFVVAPETQALRLTARWGRYERTRSETHTTSTGAPAPVWKRIPVEGVCERFELKEGRAQEWRPSSDYPDVVVRGDVRKGPDGWITTLFLVNEQSEPPSRKDTAWLFQAEVIVG